MILKYLMLAGSFLGLNLNRQDAQNPNGMVELIKKTIRTEVMNVAGKILVGLVLASSIIFAVVRVGISYHTFLLQYQDAFLIELTTFAGVIAACSIALYFLFRQQRVAPPEPIRAEHKGLLDLESIAMEFAGGFLKGFESKSQTVKQNQRTAGADI